MAKRIFIDIETLPPAENEHDYYYAKYEQYTEKQVMKTNPISFDQYFRNLALEAATGRVLTIGIIFEKDGEIVHRGNLGRERETGKFHLDEARTLKSFWNLLRGFNTKTDLIIGHNVIEFDLLFLYRRSAIKGVLPSVDLPLKRFYAAPVYDTMWEWTRWQRKISLSILADAMNISNPKNGDIDGSRVYDAFLAGRDPEIAEYCLNDVDCTREVFNRMTFRQMPAQVPGGYIQTNNLLNSDDLMLAVH